MKKENLKIQPLGDRVLIKEDNPEQKETKTKSGIIIPVTASQDKNTKQGEVVAIGPGRIEDGKLVPMNVKKGDSVLFSWGDKIKIDDQELYLVRESEIMGIIK